MRALEMIDEARDMLNDPQADLWTDEKLLVHLNRALRDVTGRARTLREAVYLQSNAGQSVYGLPVNFLAINKVAWLQNEEWLPLLKRTLSQVEYMNYSHYSYTSRPCYFDVWGRTREERIVAQVTEISRDNPTFENPDFPTHSETFGFKFEDGLMGVDAIRVRDIVINMSDGAEGIITEVRQDAPGVALYATARLRGSKRSGDDNGRILVNDFVRITSPNVSGHALRIAPAPTTDFPVGEEALWVYLSRRHYDVTIEHINEVNDELELDVELETPAFERFVYYARREELGASDPETVAQLQIYQSEYHLAVPLIRKRIRDFDSTWGSPSLSAYRANIELGGITTSDVHPLNYYDIR